MSRGPYGLNDVSLRLRATWIDPFATEADPRTLLLVAADEIERIDHVNRVAARLRNLWADDVELPIVCEEDAKSGLGDSVRNMLRVAADEIDRLESEGRGR